MTDAAATAPQTPSTPPATPKAIFPTRVLILAGCSVGGTLTASLASASQVNWPFAIVSAIFGGVLVVMTAAPAIVAPAAAAASTGGAAANAGAGAPATAPAGFGIVGIGIAAAVLSFIMNQVAQIFVGFAVFSVVPPDITPTDFLYVTGLIGIAVTGVRVPFDLLIGAYLLGRARNILLALGVFIATYIVCYLLEQVISMFFGLSGLFNTLQSGMPPLTVLTGLGIVLGITLAAQAIGAYGARIAAFVMRPRR
jgi:hypothetical protein